MNRQKNVSASGDASRSASQVFSPILRRVSLAAWMLRIIPIPFGVLTAELSANLISSAIAQNVGEVVRGGLTLLAVILGLRLFDVLTGIAYDRAASKAMHRCKMELYRRFLGCPPDVLYSTGHGKAIESLNTEFSTVTGKTTSVYPGFFTGLLTAVVYFVYLMRQSLPVALVLLGISLVQFAPPVIVKKFMQKNYDDYQDIEAENTDRTMEVYHGFAEIKMYGLKQWYLRRMEDFHKIYLRVSTRSEVTWRLEDAMDELVSSLLKYGTYGILGAFVLFGVTGTETAVAAIALSGGLFGAVKGLFGSITQFAVIRTAEKRMSAWFTDAVRETEFPADGTLILDNVTLSLGEKGIFDGLSAEISVKPGEVAVLRGANGIGKSTLFRLFTGLLKPDAGTVTVGGVSPEHLRCPDGFFYLPQDDAVFGFTAAELYEMSAGDAAKATETAHRFGLTDGHLSQNIGTLSGGERKKVFLSLGFASGARLMLLDEPTNSLDDAGRMLLAELLREYDGAVLMITHDRLFDMMKTKNYVVENGGVHVEK